MQISSIILLALSASLVVLQANADAPEVTIGNGVIRGVSITGSNGKEVYAFYGIPYAKPPVGDLRFKRAVPLTEKWDKPYEATTQPNTCPQGIRRLWPYMNGEWYLTPNTPVSEDCLYVNIWVPASQFKKNTNVYFWIYAGGFASGTITLDMYNGVNIAAEKDVIVVSAQYRVGGIGFLYFGTEDAPGNMGLIDQQTALKWVNDNIKAFGGDPKEILIMGESAGGASVSYHLMSPGSKNLFKRALMMSGNALASYAYMPPADLLEVSRKAAKDLGCLSDDDSTKTTAEIVACMRDAKLDDVIRVSGGAIRMATIDNFFISDSPHELLKRWDLKRAEVMLGNVRNEGSIVALETYTNFFSPIEAPNLPYDGFVHYMKEFLASYSPEEQEATINYYTNWINKDDGYANTQQLIDAYGDSTFNCVNRFFADAWAGRGLKIYNYWFTHRSACSPWGEWLGVRHTDDIVYVFGRVLGNSSYTEEEQNLSRKFMDLIYNFATTGNPSPNWHPYTKEFPVYVDLNATVISDETSSGLFGPRPDACGFWNHQLPLIKNSVLAAKKQALVSQSSKKSCCRKEREPVEVC